MYKTLKDINFSNKRVLVRLDLNVPIQNDTILDDTRIEKSLPTLQFLLKQHAKIIIMTHLGRPQNDNKKNLSTLILTKKLSQSVSQKVHHINDCIGNKVKQKIAHMKAQEILLLENLRFYKEEQENDTNFAHTLSKLGDIYVNDAFGTSHRSHASIVGIPQYLPSACGLLMEKEIHYLTYLVTKPKKPFMAIIGGKKVSDKILLLEALLKKVNILAIGGAMSYTFSKALGKEIGTSLFEEKAFNLTKNLIERSQKENVELILPYDHIITNTLSQKRTVHTATNTIPSGFFGVDIGPKSVQAIQNALKKCGTVIWNGPLGITEVEPFHKGTYTVAQSLKNENITSIIGGGDLASAIKKSGVEKYITHISTGGGACIQFLQQQTLTGIQALKLQDKGS